MKIKTIVLTGVIALQTSILLFVLSLFYTQSDAQQDPFDADEGEELSMDSFEGKVKIPFSHFVTGTGKILPSSGYVHINAPFAGTIKQVFVKEGDLVEKGAMLFQLDDSRSRSLFDERRQQWATALAKVHFLERGTDEKELAIKAKAVEQKEEIWLQRQKEFEIFRILLDEDAVSLREKEERESLVKIARLEKEIALMEYENLKQGRSAAEKEIARAEALEKEAKAQTIAKTIEECRIVAPITGRILKAKIHQGEFIDPKTKVALVMGSDTPLHLEVHIDEKEAWRISPTKGLKAIAIHPSNPKMHFCLNFEAIRPCMQEGAKESRKLTLIFSFDKGRAPIYLEQNLDVYIDSASPTDTAYLDYQFKQLR